MTVDLADSERYSMQPRMQHSTQEGILRHASNSAQHSMQHSVPSTVQQNTAKHSMHHCMPSMAQHVQHNTVYYCMHCPTQHAQHSTSAYTAQRSMQRHARLLHLLAVFLLMFMVAPSASAQQQPPQFHPHLNVSDNAYDVYYQYDEYIDVYVPGKVMAASTFEDSLSWSVRTEETAGTSTACESGQCGASGPFATASDDLSHSYNGTGSEKRVADSSATNPGMSNSGTTADRSTPPYGSTSYYEGSGAPNDPSAPYDLDGGPESYDPLYVYDSCVYGTEVFILNGTLDCNLIVAGADLYAELLSGGLDGQYNPVGCYAGKPIYIRVGGASGEDRTLWYNPYLGDWEFSIGTEPTIDQMVMYGDWGQVSPMNVLRWHISASFRSDIKEAMDREGNELYFVVPNILVACHDDLERWEQYEKERNRLNEWMANSVSDSWSKEVPKEGGWRVDGGDGYERGHGYDRAGYDGGGGGFEGATSAGDRGDGYGGDDGYISAAYEGDGEYSYDGTEEDGWRADGGDGYGDHGYKEVYEEAYKEAYEKASGGAGKPRYSDKSLGGGKEGDEDEYV